MTLTKRDREALLRAVQSTLVLEESDVRNAKTRLSWMADTSFFPHRGRAERIAQLQRLETKLENP